MAAKKKAAAKKAAPKRVTATEKLTKSKLIIALSEATGDDVSKKQAKVVLEALAEIGYAQSKKFGEFTLPGFAKFVIKKKPATKARKGINPFTGEETTFKAKPASKVVKARPVKAYKDAIK